MNMIYAALLCYASGNCIVPNGDPVFIYFNTREACERQAQIANDGHLKNADMKAVCFEKPGWQPVQNISQEDVSPSKDVQKLVNDLAVGCAISKSDEAGCKRAFALRTTPLTPDELMCIHKFANWARRETHDGMKYSVDNLFMLAAVSGKCAAR